MRSKFYSVAKYKGDDACSAHIEIVTQPSGPQRILGTGYDTCSRRGKIQLVGPDGLKWFCTQHARMALEGYIDHNGYTMNRLDRKDYQRRVIWPPRYRGVWKEIDE